jgi:hypothetical protein
MNLYQLKLKDDFGDTKTILLINKRDYTEGEFQDIVNKCNWDNSGLRGLEDFGFTKLPTAIWED